MALDLKLLRKMLPLRDKFKKLNALRKIFLPKKLLLWLRQLISANWKKIFNWPKTPLNVTVRQFKSYKNNFLRLKALPSVLFWELVSLWNAFNNLKWFKKSLKLKTILRLMNLPDALKQRKLNFKKSWATAKT